MLVSSLIDLVSHDGLKRLLGIVNKTDNLPKVVTNKLYSIVLVVIDASISNKGYFWIWLIWSCHLNLVWVKQRSRLRWLVMGASVSDWASHWWHLPPESCAWYWAQPLTAQSHTGSSRGRGSFLVTDTDYRHAQAPSHGIISIKYD